MKQRIEIAKEILDKYKEDKKWCIDYHNKGEVEIYNMIFGRLQGLVHADQIMGLGLGLREDMIKNVPWNKKMLAGHRTTIVEYDRDDVENIDNDNF